MQGLPNSMFWNNGIRTTRPFTSTNIGHYALTHYCHFTSPIRRYPDIMVHRILQDVLNGFRILIRKWKRNASTPAKGRERRWILKEQV